MTDQRVEGLQYVLRVVAKQLGNGAEPLSKELLERTADKLEQLEWIADVAMRIVDNTPKDGEGAVRAMVPRNLLIELARALEGTGKRVKQLRV